MRNNKQSSTVTLSLSALLAYTRQISEGLTGVLTLAQKSATGSETATRAVADVARPSSATHANKQTHLREMSAAPVARNARPASLSDDTPHAPVSDTYRTRLPKVLFDAGEGQIFPYIILTLSDGTEQQITCDAEGRSRCPSAWLGDAGQIAYFHATEPGVYTVSLSDNTAEETHTPAPRRPSAHVTAALDAAFSAPVTRSARPAQGQKTDKRKRPATQAQLDARARFATQNRVVKCAECQERVKIGDTVGGLCPDCQAEVARTRRAGTHSGHAPRAVRPSAREDARAQVAALTSLPNRAQTAVDRALSSVLRPRPVGR
jgi:hypothetical protein